MFSGISKEKSKGWIFGGGVLHFFFAEKWADEGMMRRGWSGGKPAVQHGLNYLSMSEWVEMRRERSGIGRERRERREVEAEVGGKRDGKQRWGGAPRLNSVFPKPSHIHGVCSPPTRARTHVHAHDHARTRARLKTHTAAVFLHMHVQPQCKSTP